MIIRNNALLRQLSEQLPFDPLVPWKDLPKQVRQKILFGAGKQLFTFRFSRSKKKPVPAPFGGVVPRLERLCRETKSDGLRARMMAFQIGGECEACHGSRLNARAQSVFLDGISIGDFLAMDIKRAFAFAKELRQQKSRFDSIGEAVKGLHEQLHFLDEVGLGYLTLDRDFSGLSGGEAQRVRLATQLGVGLTGVSYVLDEPSVGLHPADHAKLVGLLQELRDRGNTIIVVEHDENTTRMRLTPKTGRSHQLRLHMREIGHPILGDPFYAEGEALAAADRLMLHSERLRLRHPDGGKGMTFRAPPPF